MNTKGLFSAIAITLSATLSTPALACSQDNDMTSGILSSYPHHNQSLDFGEYAFASVNSHHNSSFTDRWKFTVAEDMIAAISVFDIEVGFASNDQTSIGKSQKNIENSPKSFDISKIFDTKNMAFTLFDDDAGQFLGWAHENETLSGLHTH
jgi:hypothetical protein